MGDTSFVKYNHRILSINKGNTPDVLTEDITVPAFRGYPAGRTIKAGTPLIDIINTEFKTPAPSYNITVTVVGSGTTDPVAGSYPKSAGNSFTMTSATPASGWNLDSVKLDGATVTLPYVIPNVTGDQTFVVTFVEAPAVTHTITASAGTGGSISPSGAVSVTDGGSKTFTITADSGKVIKDVKVDGTSVGAVSTYTFSNVTADHTIAAEFENAPVTAHTVTGTAGSNGSIAPSGAQSVADGGSISFTATPASGYVVDKWQLDGADQSETGTTFTVSNVTADHTVNVLFKAAPVTSHTITVTAGANGTISPAGPVTVSDGADQIFTIAANSGYEIEDVKVDGVSVGAVSDYTFTNVTTDHTISATFKAIPVTTYTVTPSTGAGGSISPNTAQTVNSGGSVTFTATPNTGYKVKDWKLDGASQSETGTTFTVSNVTADHTVAVEFEVIPSGNIYSGAYVPPNGRKWQEPTAANVVLGSPEADSSAVMAQIKNGAYTWTSKAITGIEIFLIAKSLGRLLNNSFEERTLTIDGVDYWCYNQKSTVNAGGNPYVLTGTEA